MSHSGNNGSRGVNGFSLIELIVTTLLISIFAMIALPGFAELIKNERLVAQNNDLISDISFARGEAMRMGSRVTICPTVDHSACTEDWSTGRMIFADTDHDAGEDMELSDGDAVLRVRQPLSGSNTMTWSGGVQRLQFMGSGLPRGGVTNGIADSFKICDSSLINNGRTIRVSTLGTVESSKGVTCP
jgi:type IV fimbrial biogenesis protein FimT